MTAPTRRGPRRLIVITVLLGIVAAGLYFGYRWPEVTATIILLALIGVWLVAERLTGRWWY